MFLVLCTSLYPLPFTTQAQCVPVTLSLSHPTTPCPEMVQSPVPSLSSPTSSSEGERLKASHIPISLLPAHYWNREGIPESFRNSSSSRYQSPRKIRSVPCSYWQTCAPFRTPLVFQWFLFIALNGGVAPGDMMIHHYHEGLSVIHCYADFLHGCTHH